MVQLVSSVCRRGEGYPQTPSVWPEPPCHGSSCGGSYLQYKIHVLKLNVIYMSIIHSVRDRLGESH